MENTSFIYLIKKFDSSTSVDDVIQIMGTNYKETDYGGYVMEYTTSEYTINGKNSTFVSFKFNSRKTKILSIKWAYKAPSQFQFNQTLQYLEDNAFGKANKVTSNKADWIGLHLEDTNYFLLFSREF